MNTLRWAQLPDSLVASFNIYRSIVGFHGPVAGLNGLTLVLKMNGGSSQTFLFTTASPVDTLNASLLGGRAFLSNDGTQFYVRSNVAAGSVEIVSGTALNTLNQLARVITPKSERELLANVLVALDPNTVLEFDDPDGTVSDYYAISTIDTNGVESRLSTFVQASTFVGPLCILKGLVTDLQGSRQVDATVTATLEIPPQGISTSSIVETAVSVLTGPDGRFNLPVLQGAMIRLEIEAIGYSRIITVPASAYAYITDLMTDTDYQLSTTVVV